MVDQNCSRCGSELRIITVRVPVPQDPIQVAEGILTLPSGQEYKVRDVVLTPEPVYEAREDVSDCPRCQGGF